MNGSTAANLFSSSLKLFELSHKKIGLGGWVEGGSGFAVVCVEGNVGTGGGGGGGTSSSAVVCVEGGCWVGV